MMKRPCTLFLTALICALSPSCRRPDVREDFVTAPNAQQGRSYPMVNSEGRVRVRIDAPYAHSVKLDIDGRKYRLRRERNGNWFGESDPLYDGFHYYRLIVDGAVVPDPSCQYYYGDSRWGSGVDIPSPDQDIYEVKNVPHGQVRGTWYWSEKKQQTRHIFVYTPAEYDRNPDKRYPVLYLLPGGAETEYSWVRQGHLAEILDNLYAEGLARPFIVVMDNCVLQNPYEWEEDYNSILTGDLIPMVDSTFRTIPDGAHRAIAGLSYGGLQTKWSVFAHPELFSAVGSFSGGAYTVAEAESHPGFAENIKLVFVSFGDAEIENPTFGIDPGTDPRQDTEALREYGMNAHLYLAPHVHHTWHAWRRSLREFAQLLFRD